jgi:hypothetical protein
MFIGAGILPVCVHPSGNILFGLGLNQDRKKNAVGWCDFGGSKKRHESVEACAAREFVEESMNIFGISQRKLKSALEEGQYLARVDVPCGRSFYVLFVVRVDYDGDLSERFKNARWKAMQRFARPECLEMQQFRWWSAAQMQFAYYRGFFPSIDIPQPIRRCAHASLRLALPLIAKKWPQSYCWRLEK